MAVFDICPQGTVTFVNEIGLKLLGYRQEEIAGQPFFKFIAPVDRSRCIATARNVMSEKYLGDNEFAIIKKDGNLMSAFIQTMPRKNKLGELMGLRAAVVQIGREKSTEASLFASEEKYRTLVNNIKLGITRGTRGPRCQICGSQQSG